MGEAGRMERRPYSRHARSGADEESRETAFTEALKRTGKRHRYMEEKRLEVERERFYKQRWGRKSLREERREEHEAVLEVELKNVSMMMKIFTGCIPKRCGEPKGAG